MIGVMAIIRKDDKFLLGVESKDSPIKGQWRFLGGRLEPGEDAVEGLKREIREEADISVNINRYLGEIEGDYAKIRIKIYLADWKEGMAVPKEDEFSRLEWLSFEDMSKSNLTKICRELVEKFQDVF